MVKKWKIEMEKSEDTSTIRIGNSSKHNCQFTITIKFQINDAKTMSNHAAITKTTKTIPRNHFSHIKSTHKPNDTDIQTSNLTAICMAIANSLSW